MKIRNRILLVEDDRDLAEVVKDFLVSQGFELLTACDAPSAFAALETFNPALVLLDLMIPGGNAFEICKKAAAGDPGSSIPVIIVSSKNSLEAKIRCYMNGALRYLTKPFEFEDLVESIRVALSRSVETSRAS